MRFTVQPVLMDRKVTFRVVGQDDAHTLEIGVSGQTAAEFLMAALNAQDVSVTVRARSGRAGLAARHPTKR